MTAPTGFRPGPSPRPVVLAGITIGTAVLVLAYWNGWQPRIPDLPPVLALLAGGAAAWLLLVVLASVAAGLLRRHHKALVAASARQAGRGTAAAARAARAGGGHLGGWLTAQAAGRWQARSYRPLMLSRAATGERDGEPGQPATRRLDGNPETDADRQFFGLRASGYAGPIDQDGNPVTTSTPRKEGGPMTAPAPPAPASGGGAGRPDPPSPWKSLIAATADFEPEDDGVLLEWMAAEVAGMSAYAEALAEVYETCVNSIGVDPSAMNAVHDTADAAAEAATAMAYARQKFAAHYAEVREFAASGGLLPYDGRWITGDGDT